MWLRAHGAKVENLGCVWLGSPQLAPAGLRAPKRPFFSKKKTVALAAFWGHTSSVVHALPKAPTDRLCRCLACPPSKAPASYGARPK